MGFYIELTKAGEKEYRETEMPPSFWLLLGVAGFALVCMGLAARNVLLTMYSQGDWFDKGLVLLFALTIPIYLGAAFKIFFLRKFVRWNPSELEIGYLSGDKVVRAKKFSKLDVEELGLVNQRPTPNNSSKYHDDPQYQIRGHWRLNLRTKKGTVVVDRSTDKEALIPLLNDLDHWRGFN